MTRYDDQRPIGDLPEDVSEYSWCMHCEKVFRTSDIVHGRRADLDIDWDRCPLCGAGEMDLWPWISNDWPRDVNPDYPEIPEVGKQYPLYGDHSINCG